MCAFYIKIEFRSEFYIKMEKLTLMETQKQMLTQT